MAGSATEIVHYGARVLSLLCWKGTVDNAVYLNSLNYFEQEITYAGL